MNIPDYLREQIKSGNVVLCLGAGASIGAKDEAQNGIINGDGLRDLLCEKFLGGKFKDRQLDQVAGYASSEASITEVENFIRSILEKFEPADFHLLIPTFRWKTIYTTNYDLVIEKAYEKQSKKVQNITPIVNNQSQPRDENVLYYVKLHGCITRSAEINSPLILTKNQYIECEQNREKLYARLTTDAFDYPIVFIGHSLQDFDILELIKKTRRNISYAPKFYLVVPSAEQIEKSYWAQQKIEILEGTFEDFLNELNNSIPSTFRGIFVKRSNKDFPIIDKITKPETQISDNLKRFLKNDVEFVSENLKYRSMSPFLFYRGVDCGWSSIEQNLDTERKITEEILIDNIIFEEEPTDFRFRMPLISAPAGTGKTILLRRIAWDASFDYQKICLYLLEHGNIDINAIKELLAISEKKIYLFIDNASRYSKFFNLIKKIPNDDLKKLTLVLAERTNEWNLNIDDNDTLPIKSYGLPNLNKKEIENLLILLGKHESLGCLKDKTLEEQIEIFCNCYNHQLLVALYESTKGRKFEDIIKDEYNNILPLDAKFIYLTVCILNRMQIPVRAGLISSIFNINLVEFEKKFFKPLEEVVYAKRDKATQDFYYEARHPYIAQIVFEQILVKQDDRFNKYYQVFSELNISYDSDRRAFREMIKANNLLELFNQNHDLISKIYEKAEEQIYNDSFVLQQKAIYEMKRPNGNFSKAKEYLTIAEANDPKNSSIKHSKAELYIKIAEHSTRTEIEMEQYLNEALKILDYICSNHQVSTYCFCSKIKIELIRLNYYSTIEGISEEIIKSIINNIEQNLVKGLQAFPNDANLLKLESELAEAINNKNRLLASLNKAFSANPRNSNIGIRLAKLYSSNNEIDEAIKILDTAIESNRGDSKLKYLKSKILFELDEQKYRSEIIYLLEKSYNDSDRNYDGKLLYGRELFVDEKYSKAFEIFEILKDAYLNEDIKTKINYPLSINYYGNVANKQVNFLFIEMDNLTRNIFAHYNENAAIWEDLNVGDRIKFKMGFNFKGPVAFEIQKQN